VIPEAVPIARLTQASDGDVGPGSAYPATRGGAGRGMAARPHPIFRIVVN
jgi:hypothetical protein